MQLRPAIHALRSMALFEAWVTPGTETRVVWRLDRTHTIILEGLADGWQRHPLGKRTNCKKSCGFPVVPPLTGCSSRPEDALGGQVGRTSAGFESHCSHPGRDTDAGFLYSPGKRAWLRSHRGFNSLLFRQDDDQTLRRCAVQQLDKTRDVAGFESQLSRGTGKVVRSTQKTCVPHLEDRPMVASRFESGRV